MCIHEGPKNGLADLKYFLYPHGNDK